MEVSGQLHALAALPPGKEPQSGYFGEEKITSPRNGTLAVGPIGDRYTAELSQHLVYVVNY
jgi:hypothetical protein